jgi:hypothetical protein
MTRAAPSATEERAAAARGRILETAEELFRTPGCQKTALADIACARHVAGNVYRFFASKSAINEAIAAAVPPVSGDGGGTRGSLGALRLPGLARMLLLDLAAFTAVFSIAAYIGPVKHRVSGLAGGGVGAVQALVGLA